MAPALIGQMAIELGQASSQDYAAEFIAALRRELKLRRNDSAIQAFKTRIVSSGGLATTGPRVTLVLLLPTRSPFVPTGGVRTDAHRKTARIAAVHRRPSKGQR